MLLIHLICLFVDAKKTHGGIWAIDLTDLHPTCSISAKFSRTNLNFLPDHNILISSALNSISFNQLIGYIYI